MPNEEEHRAELVRRIQDDLAIQGEVVEDAPSYGLMQVIPDEIVPYTGASVVTHDESNDTAERLMAMLMLRAARFAPRGGTIRFSAIDRTEAGDHVVRQAEINTEDARRIAKEQGL